MWGALVFLLALVGSYWIGAFASARYLGRRPGLGLLYSYDYELLAHLVRRVRQEGLPGLVSVMGIAVGLHCGMVLGLLVAVAFAVITQAW